MNTLALINPLDADTRYPTKVLWVIGIDCGISNWIIAEMVGDKVRTCLMSAVPN